MKKYSDSKEIFCEETKEKAAENIKAMHQLVLNLNDESAYESWITIVPDEPSDEDFEYIVTETELYDEAIRCFRYIVKSYMR